MNPAMSAYSPQGIALPAKRGRFEIPLLEETTTQTAEVVAPRAMNPAMSAYSPQGIARPSKLVRFEDPPPETAQSPRSDEGVDLLLSLSTFTPTSAKASSSKEVFGEKPSSEGDHE
jgi:hypothetical protein